MFKESLVNIIAQKVPFNYDFIGETICVNGEKCFDAKQFMSEVNKYVYCDIASLPAFCAYMPMSEYLISTLTNVKGKPTTDTFWYKGERYDFAEYLSTCEKHKVKPIKDIVVCNMPRIVHEGVFITNYLSTGSIYLTEEGISIVEEDKVTFFSRKEVTDSLERSHALLAGINARLVTINPDYTFSVNYKKEYAN